MYPPRWNLVPYVVEFSSLSSRLILRGGCGFDSKMDRWRWNELVLGGLRCLRHGSWESEFDSAGVVGNS